jgi:hypothetical protein
VHAASDFTLCCAVLCCAVLCIGATIYAESGYLGPPIFLRPGSYNTAALQARGFRGQTKSLEVFGGATIKLFKEDNCVLNLTIDDDGITLSSKLDYGFSPFPGGRTTGSIIVNLPNPKGTAHMWMHPGLEVLLEDLCAVLCMLLSHA